jgi:hypothetical protein
MSFLSFFGSGRSGRRDGRRPAGSRSKPSLELLEQRETPTAGLTLASAAPVYYESTTPAQVTTHYQSVLASQSLEADQVAVRFRGSDAGWLSKLETTESTGLTANATAATEMMRRGRYDVVDAKFTAPFATSTADASAKRTETTRTLDTVMHLAGEAEHLQAATAANASRYSVAHAAVTEDYVRQCIPIKYSVNQAVAHAAVTESSADGRGVDGTHLPPATAAKASNYSVADAVFAWGYGRDIGGYTIGPQL